MIDDIKTPWQRHLERLSDKNRELLTSYLTHLKKDDRELSVWTIDRYARSLLQFMQFLQRDVTTVQTDDLQAYKTHLQKKGNKPETVNIRLIPVNLFLRFLKKERGLDIQAREIKRIKIHEQKYLDHYITRNDFDRLVRAIERKQDLRAKALVYTLFYTGARLSEMLSLPASALHQKTVTIIGKGKKVRKLFIADTLQRVWEEYAEAYPQVNASPFLFFGRRPNTPMGPHTVRMILKYYAGQARMKKSYVHPHAFRHGFAVQLDKQGFSIVEIADLLGHADINTTRIYQQRTEQELRSKLEQVL